MNNYCDELIFTRSGSVVAHKLIDLYGFGEIDVACDFVDFGEYVAEPL